MDEARLGREVRAIRQRRRWRQIDLAAESGVSRGMVSRVERGHAGEVTIGGLLRICRALDAALDVRLRWQGGDLDRLINSHHAAMHDAIARLLGICGGWVFAPEVSFSIFGERGVIDVLAWHEATRTLLVIELKSEIVDLSDLVGTVDRKRRLAIQVGRERGWVGKLAGAWVVVADTSANRRRFAAHAAMLRAAFPGGGNDVRAWLAAPSGRLAALSFLPSERHDGLVRSFAPTKRVRRATQRARPLHSCGRMRGAGGESDCAAARRGPGTG